MYMIDVFVRDITLKWHGSLHKLKSHQSYALTYDLYTNDGFSYSENPRWLGSNNSIERKHLQSKNLHKNVNENMFSFTFLCKFS